MTPWAMPLTQILRYETHIVVVLCSPERMHSLTVQYLMGHSDIGVTMNTYTHLGLEDAKDEMIRMEELNAAKKELEKTIGEKPVTQKMFRVV